MPSNEKPIMPQDACYLLTLNTVDKIDVFVRPAYKQVIVEALNFFVAAHGLSIYSWCLMSSHLHLVVRAKDGTAPAYFERDFKKFTTPVVLKAVETEADMRKDWMMERFEAFANSFGRMEKFHLWQNCSSPLRVDCADPKTLLDQINHIHENPVRDRIVEHPENYIYSSARDYAGMKGLVQVRVVQQQGIFGIRKLSVN